jgi:hypothetical protein
VAADPAGSTGSNIPISPAAKTRHDGVETRVILDSGASVIDWRGWYVNAGA